MEPFYRAKLFLERVEPFTDDRGHAHARITEIASLGFTGADADDAMYQMRNHVETLHDWHETQADQASALDEAFDPAADKLLAEVGRALAKMPKVVCLCGSTRFYDAFQQANYDETMAGNIVLSVGFYPHSKAIHGHGEGVGHDSAEKVKLDELHLRKIDLADEVLILNVGGYVGDSTRREIDYAISRGKTLRWLEPGTPDTPEAIAERARPFVACKAPDPVRPGWFCKRPLGHSSTVCDFVPVEELPASADDEGDETAERPDSKACPCDQFCPDGERCDGLTTHEAVAQLNAEQRAEEHPDDELGRASAALLAAQGGIIRQPVTVIGLSETHAGPARPLGEPEPDQQ